MKFMTVISYILWMGKWKLLVLLDGKKEYGVCEMYYLHLLSHYQTQLSDFI